MPQTLFWKNGFGRHLNRSDLWICLALVAGTLVWAGFAGKDLNWDQLNYHFYVGSSAFNDRLGHDFMAANGQSYLNPLAYIPFAWMVSQQWHSLLVASILAAFHALNVIFVYLITRTVLAEHPGPSNSNIVAGLGAALAWLSPMFLTLAGTTFADITTSVFVLAALLLSLHADVERRWWSNWLLFGGLMHGVACGLKLSNLVFSPAFALLLIWLHPSPARSIRALLLFGLGGALGLIASHGYWSWVLWNAFGDLGSAALSVLLGAPGIPPTTVSLPHRFLPETPLDVLLLPFRMMQLRGWIYVETVSPDLRFAAVMLLCMAGPVVWFIKRRRNAQTTTCARPLKSQAFGLFFAATFVLWVCTSANGRYGIVVSILCGAVLATLAQVLLRRPALVIGTLAVLIGLQAFHLQNADSRFGAGQWTPSWYEVTMSERLRREPFLYVSLGVNSNSYIAPFLARESAFTAPVGQISFELEGPVGERFRALFDRYEGRVRLIGGFAGSAPDEQSIAGSLGSVDHLVARFGFAVDASDCEMITTSKSRAKGANSENKDVTRFTTCALRPRPYARTAERDRVRKAADKITAWCPKLFGTYYSVVEEAPAGWYARYAPTDATLHVKDERIFLTQPRALVEVDLGTLDYWEGTQRPDCAAIPERLRNVYTVDRPAN